MFSSLSWWGISQQRLNVGCNATETYLCEVWLGRRNYRLLACRSLEQEQSRTAPIRQFHTRTWLVPWENDRGYYPQSLHLHPQHCSTKNTHQHYRHQNSGNTRPKYSSPFWIHRITIYLQFDKTIVQLLSLFPHLLSISPQFDKSLAQ